MSTSNGKRRRTRKKFSHKPDFRPAITKFLTQYSEGQQVVIMQEPSSHKGMPFRRFKGRIGYIVGRRGKVYIVEIQDGNSVKRVISRPEHLKMINRRVE
jgi:large subunit ribosomal protein L21e